MGSGGRIRCCGWSGSDGRHHPYRQGQAEENPLAWSPGSSGGAAVVAEIEGILLALPYREIWVVDFEFRAPDGERPEPICMVARELHGGRLLELWADELRACARPPFDVGSDALFVAFYASAELGCFLALGWPMPARILDLFAEFRVATNGKPAGAGGSGLIGAALWHSLEAMAVDEKAQMRALVLRGGPYTTDERRAVLDYCRADVDTLAALLPRMLPELLSRQPVARVALGQALLRGRYMAAAACWPERYRDKRGAVMWETVTGLVGRLDQLESSNAAAQVV